ncbi:MAG: DUF3347 domain-containing protein, partial [Bacteroidales bacterium]|nr:DUF3347 domain-containing protein [Bacteroidales bacterium]
GDMEGSASSMEEEQKPLQWPSSQSDQYKKLTESYLALKNALVNDKMADSQAEKMVAAISKVNMGAFSNKGHMKWMEHQEAIDEKARAIQNADKLEVQREHFIKLSDHMIALVKTFSVPKGELYVQFCPMANNDKGAFWLSGEDQVENPYFGDQMLTCGEVREEVGK